MASAYNPHLISLLKRVSKAPPEPGIYKWLDDAGRVLYVGKAKNLKKRLSSYLSPARKSDGPWKQSFLQQIADFDVTVTTNELEALLLETNLIKQLRPKYNVLMKDDKNYLFIRISMQDAYPSVETVRRFEQDGAKYFGPYMNGHAVGNTLDLLNEAIGHRACKQSICILNRNRKPDRPCLEFQIGRCNGLCAGKITKEEYRNRIEQIASFLKGRKDSVKGILLERMRAAAKDRKFELATKLRNYINVIEDKTDQQVASDGSGENSDVLGVAILSNRAHVTVLHRRNGRLIGESHFALSGQPESVAAVLGQFAPQYYDCGREIPEAVILPAAPPDGCKAMEMLLLERRKRAVSLVVPSRGKKSRLLQLAERNAREKARQMELKWEADERNTTVALEELTDILKLPTIPKRIEGYDISHLGGTETVGSMAVIKNGKAANDQYRSFTIRTMKSGEVDDCKAIKEILTRRLRKLTEDLPTEEKKWNEAGLTFGKAVNKDRKAIEEIHAQYRICMKDIGVHFKNYVIARHGQEIIGFGRLYKHTKGIMELQSIWVHERFQGSRLNRFIARKILRGVKKGKVYVLVTPELEQCCAEIGFRHVITPPKIFQECMASLRRDHSQEQGPITMMWESRQNKSDASFAARPDLMVIDGGRGQLSAAVDVLKALQLDMPVVSLAKREEEIFVPGRSNPITCPPESPAKFLLMRLRDEAHRFANAHREKRALNAIKASHLR